ncbi:MAG: hypothetical protein AUI14_11380 [Actinobacteria bacterium 13_2_20CM_2_71_6]|nr:MAG: hypothetical protein AUI14_11380 [Actinobacteria bacterium 13_2_20CM_2_71_6]
MEGVSPERTHRHEDGVDLPVLVWRLAEPELVISSAALGGGIGTRHWVVNATVPLSYARTDPAAHLAEIARGLGLAGPGTGLLTGVDVGRVVTVVDGGVTVSATVGLGDPIWAAAADLGIPGTGTCTDATVVSCPPQGPVEGYGGPRSTWGARLARAAYEAIVRGGRDWLADPRSWSAAVVGPEDAAAAPASHGAAPTAPGADNAAVAPDSAAVAPDSAAVAADPNRGAGALLASGIVRTDASLRPRTNPT